MGKDLKGKNLGKGITQEKTTEYYVARFVDRFGKRQSKRFKKLQEAKNWLDESQYIDETSDVSMPRDMTVNAFFEFWHDTKQKMIRKSSADYYKLRYNVNIKPIIGDMKLTDVKVNHCQMIVNKMIDDNKANSTIARTCTVMRGLFDYAVECDVIMKSPCRIKIQKSIGKQKKCREALTIDAQKKFLQTVKGHNYENHYRFILQTGLRIGELIGLKWEDVDFKKKTIRIKRSLKYEVGKGTWHIGEPKSEAGKRTIPLTDEAIEILKSQKEQIDSLKVVPLEWGGYVFLNKNGEPVTNDAYNSALVPICRRADINRITVHVLRHSFATRAIESGMRPKTLQTIMGHSTISLTMDLYVHTTDDEMFNEMDLFSNALKMAL